LHHEVEFVEPVLATAS